MTSTQSRIREGEKKRMNEQNFEFLMRLLLAAVCGACIGYERKNKNKGAGVRTHSILALGSALMMIISKYGFMDSASFDASRVAASVVSGIGFIGAGIIFMRDDNLHGVTTSAGIWSTSGIGMAIGAGMYVVGVFATVLIIGLQLIFHHHFFLTHERHIMQTIVIELENNDQELENLESLPKKHSAHITSIKKRGENGDLLRIVVNIEFSDLQEKEQFANTAIENEGILSLKLL